jgi:hypothetical protein
MEMVLKQTNPPGGPRKRRSSVNAERRLHSVEIFDLNQRRSKLLIALKCREIVVSYGDHDVMPPRGTMHLAIPCLGRECVC